MYFIILFLFCQDFRRVKTQNSNYDFWKLPKKYKYVWIKLQAESKIQYSQYDYTVFSVIPLGLRNTPLRITRFFRQVIFKLSIFNYQISIWKLFDLGKS